jgi:4-hydroxy-3-polyprenylbenzoate decarboxylase
MKRDLLFSHGPLDVLDHSSDAFSFGGKLGIDATIKHPEEKTCSDEKITSDSLASMAGDNFLSGNNLVVSYNPDLVKAGIPVMIVSVSRFLNQDAVENLKELFRQYDPEGIFRLIIAVDHTVDTNNLHMVAWQLLGNSDPKRDHTYISSSSLIIDGTIKAFRKGGFPRKWPNVVCSDSETISAIDKKWKSLGIGPFIQSPSEIYRKLVLRGGDEIIINEP